MLLGVALPLSIALSNIVLGFGILIVFYRLATEAATRKKLLTGITIPLMIYLTVDLTATLFSGFPVQLKSLFEDKWVLSAYFIMLLLPKNDSDRNYAVTGLIFSATLMALYATFQSIFGWDYLRNQALEPFGKGFIAVGVFSHHLTYGGIALIALLIVLTRTILQPDYFRSIRWYIVILICSVGLFVSYSRSAIVGLVFGIGTLTLFVNPKVRRSFIAVVLVCIILALVLVPGLTDRFLNAFSSGEHNEGPRIRLWLTSIEIIKHNPIFGVGQGNFQLGFDQYKLPGYYHNSAHPHNDFLSVAVDGGLIALACFLSIWLLYYIKTLKQIRTYNQEETQSWIQISGIAVVTAILVAGLFQNYQTDAEVANLLWFMVGISFSKRAMNEEGR